MRVRELHAAEQRPACFIRAARLPPLVAAVGPVWVETPDQVLQIYENMKADGRLRFFF